MNAKLQTIQAQKTSHGPRGRIWSTGLHHVFVDDKPARVYVPQVTVLDTFHDLTRRVNDGGCRFGVDHLPQSIYEGNEILAKMNLHDVGSISKVVYDGEAIYIDESHLTNTEVQRLHETGELPAYSIVGAMEASPCPDERADYVVDKIRIERVDFVEEGGCQVCTTSAEPGEILITSKKSKALEAENVNEQEEQNEDVGIEEAPVVEEPVVSEDEPKPVEKEEEEEEPEAQEEAEDPEPEVQDDKSIADEPPATEEGEDVLGIIKELAQELKDLKQQLGGKKPKSMTAKHSEGHKTIEGLIKAGKATPAQKDHLQRLHDADPEAFHEYTETMKPIVDMKTRAKNPKPESTTRKGDGDEEITAERILEIMRNR